MTTLYIRGVDDDVARSLRERAEAAGQSLNSYVNAELAKLASRPTNAHIVARLRDRDRRESPPVEDIVAQVRATRR